MTSLDEPRRIWLLKWSTSVDGAEPAKIIGYTSDPAVAIELEKRGRKCPYAQAHAIEVREITMKDLPR